MGWLLLRPTTAIPARAFIQVRALSASSRRRRPAGPLPADYRVVEVDCGSSGSVAISYVHPSNPSFSYFIHHTSFSTTLLDLTSQPHFSISSHLSTFISRTNSNLTPQAHSLTFPSPASITSTEPLLPSPS